MAKALMPIKIFADKVEECHQILHEFGVDLKHMLLSENKTSMTSITSKFCSTTAIEIALFEVMKALDITPDGIIGHSFGEIACAYADGCLTTRDAMVVTYFRGVVTENDNKIPKGLMAVIGLSSDEAINVCPKGVYVVCNNAKDSVVCSGSMNEMKSLINTLTKSKVFVRQLESSEIPFHTKYLITSAKPLMEAIKKYIPNPRLRSRKWVSTSLMTTDPNDQALKYASAEYFVYNLLNPQLVWVVTDEFCVLESDNICVVGKMRTPDDEVLLTPNAIFDRQNLMVNIESSLDREDIYKKLGVLGLDYGPHFQRLKSIHTNDFRDIYGINEWDGNLVTYLDAMMQTIIFLNPNSFIMLPVMIRAARVDPRKLFNALRVSHKLIRHDDVDDTSKQSSKLESVISDNESAQYQLELNSETNRFNHRFCIFSAEMPFYFNKKTKRLVAHGLEVEGLISHPILRRTEVENLVLESTLSAGAFQMPSVCVVPVVPLIPVVPKNMENTFTEISNKVEHDLSKDIINQIEKNERLIRSLVDIVCENFITTNELKVTEINMTPGVLATEVEQNIKQFKIMPFDVDYNLVVNSKQDILEIYKKPYGGNFRYIFHMDTNSVTNIDFNTKPYSDILANDLVANVIKGGELGTYRHFKLPADYDKMEANEYHLNFGQIRRMPIRDDDTFSDCVLGSEYVGRRADTGERVMGIEFGRTLANSVKATDKYMTTVPEHWSMAEAVTVLNTYSTVHYGLIKKANVKKGESILIHSAAGGVGQAAINVCKHYECDIFATVGTEEKKQFLINEYNIPENKIFNSRDILFKIQIMDATDGKGVDVVLNSLTGEKLSAGFECLAISGRFVEIGKYDMIQNKQLGMYGFFGDMEFIGVAVDAVILNDHDYLQEFYGWLHKHSMNGCVKPLNYKCFVAKDVEKAFQYMATGKHIGKIVIKMRDEEMERKSVMKIKSVPNRLVTVKTYFNPNKVYIITGGLGGFGLELIPWMQYSGARKFVVTSRSVFSSIACGKGNAGQSNYAFGNSMCERICEERRRDGLHGLAVQFGPIGDVGVFADSSDQLLMMSSLRKQRINSCCDVLDKFIVNMLWRSLGIDPNNTPNDLTLGEIGIESMFAVELQQEFEREWNQSFPLMFIKISFADMEELANKINRPVIGINWTRELSEMTTFKDMNQYYVNILKTLEPSGRCDIVGYFDNSIACVKLVLKGMVGKAIIVDVTDSKHSEPISDTTIMNFILGYIAKDLPESYHGCGQIRGDVT
ncbi:unnamed protein product [Medioppia subpectinata]|uniref:Uncharacterized protein n=1 Tax=Medioppia subpectinata TaxID=1979941 RepID=A0A7R9KFS1_9ACAR|nr:unnamed protein product [Medioppia subpectinata]CAG2102742.1 unnamed protein product [Medioppia subpectinata]